MTQKRLRSPPTHSKVSSSAVAFNKPTSSSTHSTQSHWRKVSVSPQSSSLSSRASTSSKQEVAKKSINSARGSGLGVGTSKTANTSSHLPSFEEVFDNENLDDILKAADTTELDERDNYDRGIPAGRMAARRTTAYGGAQSQNEMERLQKRASIYAGPIRVLKKVPSNLEEPLPAKSASFDLPKSTVPDPLAFNGARAVPVAQQYETKFAPSSVDTYVNSAAPNLAATILNRGAVSSGAIMGSPASSLSAPKRVPLHYPSASIITSNAPPPPPPSSSSSALSYSSIHGAAMSASMVPLPSTPLKTHGNAISAPTILSTPHRLLQQQAARNIGAAVMDVLGGVNSGSTTRPTGASSLQSSFSSSIMASEASSGFAPVSNEKNQLMMQLPHPTRQHQPPRASADAAKIQTSSDHKGATLLKSHPLVAEVAAASGFDWSSALPLQNQSVIQKHQQQQGISINPSSAQQSSSHVSIASSKLSSEPLNGFESASQKAKSLPQSSIEKPSGLTSLSIDSFEPKPLLPTQQHYSKPASGLLPNPFELLGLAPPSSTTKPTVPAIPQTATAAESESSISLHLSGLNLTPESDAEVSDSSPKSDVAPVSVIVPPPPPVADVDVHRLRSEIEQMAALERALLMEIEAMEGSQS